jgi:hypothetical protein
MSETIEHPREQAGEWGPVPAMGERWTHPIHGAGVVVSVEPGRLAGVEMEYENLSVTVYYPSAEHFVHQGHRRIVDA